MSPPYSEETVPDNAPEHCPVSVIIITTTVIEATDPDSLFFIHRERKAIKQAKHQHVKDVPIRIFVPLHPKDLIPVSIHQC